MTDETVEEPPVEPDAEDDPATDPDGGADADTAGDAADAGSETEVDDAEPSGADVVVDETAAPRRRGSLAIYGVAFALLLIAAACLVVGALGILSIVDVAETSVFGTQRILRISAVFAGLSIVAAIVAVFAPRRSR